MKLPKDQIGEALDAPIPDVVEPIRGFRKWEWDEYGLSSFSGKTRWDAAEPVHARCFPSTYTITSYGNVEHPNPSGHECPWDPHNEPQAHSQHGCGIYAYASIEDAWRNLYDCSADVQVFGEVELWGKVWPHEHGYRGEFARPVVLYRMPDARPTIWGPAVDALARMYGCEVRDFPLDAEVAEGLAVEGATARAAVYQSHYTASVASMWAALGNVSVSHGTTYTTAQAPLHYDPFRIAATGEAITRLGVTDEPKRRWYRARRSWHVVVGAACAVFATGDALAGRWAWAFAMAACVVLNARAFREAAHNA